jgi:hypothetical protein
VNSRWKPTVMPRAVRRYMPSSSPSSTQLKPQPHKKTAAAPRPRNGRTTARRFATYIPAETRPGFPTRDGSSATGSATGKTVTSTIVHLLCGPDAHLATAATSRAESAKRGCPTGAVKSTLNRADIVPSLSHPGGWPPPPFFQGLGGGLFSHRPSYSCRASSGKECTCFRRRKLYHTTWERMESGSVASPDAKQVLRSDDWTNGNPIGAGGPLTSKPTRGGAR